MISKYEYSVAVFVIQKLFLFCLKSADLIVMDAHLLSIL